jgi:hypothetical protein
MISKKKSWHRVGGITGSNIFTQAEKGVIYMSLSKIYKIKM